MFLLQGKVRCDHECAHSVEAHDDDEKPLTIDRIVAVRGYNILLCADVSMTILK